MRVFKNIRLAAKLLASFGILLAVLVVVGVFSLHRLSTTVDFERQVTQDLLPGIDALTRMSAILAEMRIGELRYIDARNEAEAARYERESDENLAKFNALRATFVTYANHAEERSGWERAE